jgi:hypothetical protein
LYIKLTNPQNEICRNHEQLELWDHITSHRIELKDKDRKKQRMGITARNIVQT